MPQLPALPLPGLARESVRNKVVLVTGASRGIGAAIAAELAERGARVALVARDTAALADVAAGLRGDGHAWFAGDVRSQESVDAAVAAAVDRFGRLDAVVANAGVVSYGSVLVCDTADFERVVDTNLTGVYRTVRAALPALRDSAGYVLVMGSISSFASLGGLASYASSKAGAEMLAHILQQELDHLGIAVGTLYASWVDTDLVADAERVMPSFAAVRRRWARPAGVPGLRAWPGGTAAPADCARVAVTAIERRQRRAWVPLPLWGLSFARVVVNSRPGERVQARLFGPATRAADAEVVAHRRATAATAAACGPAPSATAATSPPARRPGPRAGRSPG
jgi:NAD(P)-dependent dehydrogenase (short-subunit alcohol dehydrogenase family)